MNKWHEALLSYLICAGAVCDVAAQPPASLTLKLAAQGLVDARTLDSTIVVELKYADTLNFMKQNVYGDLRGCYLRPEAAKKLVRANAILRNYRPGLRLLVADAVRPRHVQRAMWDIVVNTPRQKYVANPRWGSMHNYGCAVDVTIVDSAGNRLDMGTEIDHFGPLAQPRLESRYLKTGRLTKQQTANRALLRSVMREAGFHPIAIEWWHFNAFDKRDIRTRFEIVE
jgi:D-alanyl-D-alanine dipeptidase